MEMSVRTAVVFLWSWFSCWEVLDCTVQGKGYAEVVTRKIDAVSLIRGVRRKELWALVDLKIIHTKLHRADEVVFKVSKIYGLVYYQDVRGSCHRVVIRKRATDNGAAFDGRQ